jgi:hypothetical protein
VALMHTLTSFGGVVFADIDWEAGFPAETLRGQWDVGSSIIPRTGNTSIVGPGAISPRTLIVDFFYVGAGDQREAMDELIGLLNPTDQTPRLLVGARYDATDVQRYAKLSMPAAFDSEGNVNVVRAVFTSEDPAWVATTPVTESASDDASPFQLPITNAGQATVHPVYRIGWTAQHSAVGTVVGQQYRRRMTLTNTQDRVLAPFPYRIDLGDTAALTTAKAQADGDDVRIIINGEDMTRKLIGWDLTTSYVWITIPGMDAGEVLTIDLVYGNASATDPDDWSSILDLTRPVPDMKYETGTATGGNTTDLTLSTATWDEDEWYGGILLLLTGTLAGQSSMVSFNNATTLTVDTAFGATIDAGDTFLLTKSSNARWIYNTLQVEHTGLCRGRFNVNSGSYPPSAISYDAPGSWQPALVRDNRDEFGQKRFSFLTMGGSDRDPFALLDVRRQWEGNIKDVPELGTADGLSLTTPMPIEGINWEWQISNQNGMCTVYVGVRESGAEDWAEAYSDPDVTAGSSFVDRIFDVATTLDLVTDFDPIYQIVTALLPVNDIEIPLDWKRDQGSATSGSTNYTEDLSKEWVVDQFADNGYIAMLSGPNSGRKRNVTDNTAVRLNHDAFPHANDDGDRYVVTNKPIRGLLRDGTKLYVDLDDSVLSASALGAETAVYDVSFALWVGADGPSGDPAGQHRALIGWAGGEKRVFLTADEVVEIDSAARRVRIYNTATEEYGDELTDPAVIVQYHDGTSWRRSANWLPLGTGEQAVWIEETNIGTLDLTVTYTPAYLG